MHLLFHLVLSYRSKELDATTEQVTYLTEQLMAFLYKIQVYKVHTQTTFTLVQPHCLFLAQIGK